MNYWNKIHLVCIMMFLLPSTSLVVAQGNVSVILPSTNQVTEIVINDDPFATTSNSAQAPQQVTASATSPTADKPDEETQQEALLFAELQKLKYDRRPSMILRTWADLEAAQSTNAVKVTSQTTAAAPAIEVAGSTSGQPSFDAPPRPWSTQKVAQLKAAHLKELQSAAAADAKRFGQYVTTGQWKAAGEILRQLKPTNQQTIFRGMLAQFLQIRKDFLQLASVDGLETGSINNQQFFERNVFGIQDLEGILAMAPLQLERVDLTTIGQIAATILETGVAPDALRAKLEALVAATPDSDKLVKTPDTENSAEQPAESDAKSEIVARPLQPWLTKREAAWIMLQANQLEAAEAFLPSVDRCVANNDAEGLNMLARLTLSKSVEDAPDQQEVAWNILQTVINSQQIAPQDKNEALLRAVALVPKLDRSIGRSWLQQLYRDDESKTREILAVMGERVSRGFQTLPHSPEVRGDALEMMKVATEVLFQTRPELAESWQELVDLLATTWLREARFSQQFDNTTSLGPQLQRDQYGNFYYYDPFQYQRSMMGGSGQRPTPVGIEQVLKTIPEGDWFQQIDDSLKPEISMICANMLLKVNEEERAFPYIESLAKTHKDKAQELAEQFLRVWTQNHDMNATRGNNRYSPYYYAYGFNQSAESIPLTRSKQERNLKDLTRWMAALRALPEIEINQDLLANAFTTCHSGAEVYRFEEIEEVFGPMAQMDPNVLAALSEKMRANLTGQWQIPDVQKQNNTKRTKKDIAQQVLDGYILALQTVEQAIQQHPDNWRLQLQKACLLFDDNEYRSVLQNRNEYSQQRKESYVAFDRAAQAYAKFARQSPPHEYSVDVFEKWFYAMLGNTDLARIDADTASDQRETDKILRSIQQLGEPLVEEHLKRFSNVVVTRVGMANPAIKFTFLTEGFKITGDRPEVTQAKRLHEYYRDLVTELNFEAILDGSDNVSPSQPFGVFVRINHTPEIERESGGFGRFLQNQSSLPNAYNYGRPAADYRDRFEEAARVALSEHFEVLSVTFEKESVKSQALNRPGKPGWRTTPYAYLLLQPRNSTVDRLPTLKIDLDFLDTTGYIVLPISTSELPLKATDDIVASRPWEELRVTQTLDHREGNEGKLTLEIKASCLGLVPELDSFLTLEPDEFEIAEINDSLPMVSTFDAESAEMRVVSERTWEIKLKGRNDLPTTPDQFQFGQPVADVEIAEWSRMGFDDEDIVEMEPIVKLEGDYGEAATPWLSIVTFGSATLLGVVVLSVLVLGMKQSGKQSGPRRTTESMSPFALIAALSERLESGQLSRAEEAELREEIHRLEESHFGQRWNSQEESGEPPLNRIADKWLSKV